MKTHRTWPRGSLGEWYFRTRNTQYCLRCGDWYDIELERNLCMGTGL